MFSDTQMVRLPVALTLTNGETVKGCLLLSRAQKLIEIMNKPEPFVEFEARDAEPVVLAKSGIAKAALLEERQSRPGKEQLRKPTKLDPYKILGIAKDAPASAVRPAYVEKAKLYHPDQFAAQPLPPEVAEYLAAMFGQVQQAYETLTETAEKTAA